MSKKGKELVKPGFELCGRLSGVDSEKKDMDIFSGKLTKLYFYSESVLCMGARKKLTKIKVTQMELGHVQS